MDTPPDDLPFEPLLLHLSRWHAAPFGTPLGAPEHALFRATAAALHALWALLGTHLNLRAEPASVVATIAAGYRHPEQIAAALQVFADRVEPTLQGHLTPTLRDAMESLRALRADLALLTESTQAARALAARAPAARAPAECIEVVAAVILRDARALLVRSKKHDDTVTPGGRIEAGETPEAALVREVREETGLAVTSVGPYLGAETRGRYRVHFYLATVDPGEPVAGSDARAAEWGDPIASKDCRWILEGRVVTLGGELVRHRADLQQGALALGLDAVPTPGTDAARAVRAYRVAQAQLAEQNAEVRRLEAQVRETHAYLDELRVLHRANAEAVDALRKTLAGAFPADEVDAMTPRELVERVAVLRGRADAVPVMTAAHRAQHDVWHARLRAFAETQGVSVQESASLGEILAALEERGARPPPHGGPEGKGAVAQASPPIPPVDLAPCCAFLRDSLRSRRPLDPAVGASLDVLLGWLEEAARGDPRTGRG